MTKESKPPKVLPEDLELDSKTDYVKAFKIAADRKVLPIEWYKLCEAFMGNSTFHTQKLLRELLDCTEASEMDDVLKRAKSIFTTLEKVQTYLKQEPGVADGIAAEIESGLKSTQECIRAAAQVILKDETVKVTKSHPAAKHIQRLVNQQIDSSNLSGALVKPLGDKAGTAATTAEPTPVHYAGDHTADIGAMEPKTEAAEPPRKPPDKSKEKRRRWYTAFIFKT